MCAFFFSTKIGQKNCLHSATGYETKTTAYCQSQPRQSMSWPLPPQNGSRTCCMKMMMCHFQSLITKANLGQFTLYVELVATNHSTFLAFRGNECITRRTSNAFSLSVGHHPIYDCCRVIWQMQNIKCTMDCMEDNRLTTMDIRCK